MRERVWSRDAPVVHGTCFLQLGHTSQGSYHLLPDIKASKPTFCPWSASSLWAASSLMKLVHQSIVGSIISYKGGVPPTVGSSIIPYRGCAKKLAKGVPVSEAESEPVSSITPCFLLQVLASAPVPTSRLQPASWKAAPFLP